jgi:hypothetical protein
MKTILLLATIEVLMITSVFALWYLRRRPPQTHAVIKGNPSISAKTPFENERDASRWSFINAWQVTPQHDDRKPLRVMRQRPGGFAPADRSAARRSHQRMYRQWSGERHD